MLTNCPYGKPFTSDQVGPIVNAVFDMWVTALGLPAVGSPAVGSPWQAWSSSETVSNTLLGILSHPHPSLAVTLENVLLHMLVLIDPSWSRVHRGPLGQARRSSKGFIINSICLRHLGRSQLGGGRKRVLFVRFNFKSCADLPSVFAREGSF